MTIHPQYDPILYKIEGGFNKDKPQTFFNYPLLEKVELKSIKSLLKNNKEKEFEIFTDGVCKFIKKELNMGIGFIIALNKERDKIIFSAKYFNYRWYLQQNSLRSQ